MKYDIHLFEQLNEEYKPKPLKTLFPQYDPDSQLKIARSRIATLNKLVSLKGARILVIGCGLGYLSYVLASECNCRVIGIDLRKRADWDLLKTKSPNLDYQAVDLSSENPFDMESFDLIVSFWTWEHVIHPFTLLRECCKVLKPSAAIYIDAQLYRGPSGSHKYREVFFPFPHLLFEEEVFSEYYVKHTEKGMTSAWLNKLTYSQYKEYFRILNLRIEHEELVKIPLDKDFYNRFKDKLERYPIFDLELDCFRVLLRKPEQSALQEALVEQNKLKSDSEAVRNSFSFRLGHTLVQAVRWPGRNTVFLPYRLVRLCVIEFKKQKTKETRKVE